MPRVRIGAIIWSHRSPTPVFLDSSLPFDTMMQEQKPLRVISLTFDSRKTIDKFLPTFSCARFQDDNEVAKK